MGPPKRPTIPKPRALSLACDLSLRQPHQPVPAVTTSLREVLWGDLSHSSLAHVCCHPGGLSSSPISAANTILDSRPSVVFLSPPRVPTPPVVPPPRRPPATTQAHRQGERRPGSWCCPQTLPALGAQALKALFENWEQDTEASK
ncbi:Smoothelin-like protein 2 [Camelus dromedarius]|uniref:Smoothelin-like protein 2 n=1 Tax=Camelus dromedarius TaxID=9838 RepID=A0A5N4D345_CAMDR|nr:Smoothelin-like protein 2 [Camelus dromedarius]